MTRETGIALWRTIFWLMFLSPESFASVSEPADLRAEHLDGSFTLQHPADLSFVRASNMPDFVIYKVIGPGGKQLLLIYLGNFPDNRMQPPKNAINTSLIINGFAATSSRWRHNHAYSGSTLIKLGSGAGWPAFAHFVFMNLTASDATLAEKIIKSFRADRARAGQ